jgi:hypothetical protein
LTQSVEDRIFNVPVESSNSLISFTGSSPTESGPSGNSTKKVVSGWEK